MKRPKKIRNNPFIALDFSDRNCHQKVVQVLSKSLSKSSRQDRPFVSRQLLQALFQYFSFDLNTFIKNCRLTPKQTASFLSFLLYCLYYREITVDDLQRIHSNAVFEHIFTLLLAEVIEEPKLNRIISTQALKKQLSLICYCCLHPREGAWAILEAFEKHYQTDLDKTVFLKLLKRKYFDAVLLETLLNQTPEDTTINISYLKARLESKAQEELKNIANSLPRLIELIINLPLELAKTNASSAKASLETHTKLIEMFKDYRGKNYPLDKLSGLFQLFGLYGTLIPPFATQADSSLSLTLQSIEQTLKNPATLEQPLGNTFGEIQISHLITLVLKICEEFEAFHHHPNIYIKGLDRLVYALSTRGSHFQNLPWLPSVLKGLHELTMHLHAKGFMHFNLNKVPIVIFDQAEGSQLKKNKTFIRKLTQKYEATLWHLSKDQTLKLAKKLGVHSWIETGAHQSFGFGGARNAVFFLAPFIGRAHQMGIKTFSKLMQLPKSISDLIFDEAVMGKNGNDTILHLGEDDVGLMPCHLFADALFCEKNKGLYFCRSAYGIGRATQKVNPFLDFESIIKEPGTVFSSTFWSNKPFLAGMKGMLSKPRFCLPLPFGNEEAHVTTPLMLIDFFEPPIQHLGGTRFPKTLFPKSPLDGILEYLIHYLPYSLQIDLCSTLFDTTNDGGRCPLPWNDKALKNSGSISCFKDLWEFAASPDTLKELKQKFWQNMQWMFMEGSCPAKQKIEALICVNIHSKAPQELKKFYRKIKQDAELFLELGKSACLLYQNKQDNPAPVKFFLKNIKQQAQSKCQTRLSKTTLAKGLFLIIERIESLDDYFIRR